MNLLIAQHAWTCVGSNAEQILPKIQFFIVICTFFFACDPQRIIRNENKQRYGLVFICLLNMIHSPLHQCAVITNIIYIFLHKYRYKTIAFHLSIVNSLFIHSFIYLLYINNIISLFIFHSVCSLPQQLLLTHNTHTHKHSQLFIYLCMIQITKQLPIPFPRNENYCNGEQKNKNCMNSFAGRIKWCPFTHSTVYSLGYHDGHYLFNIQNHCKQTIEYLQK